MKPLRIPLLIFLILGPAYVMRAENIEQDMESLIEKNYVVSTCNELNIGDAFSVYDPVVNDGRKFIVTSLFDGKATISGTISKGDFKFSTIYPYDAVSTWKGSDDYEIYFPSEQLIASNNIYDGRALVSGVFETDPGKVIECKTIYSPIEFDINRNDVSQIDISLSDTSSQFFSTYSVKPESGVFEKGKCVAFVKPECADMELTYVAHTNFAVEYSGSRLISFDDKRPISLGNICKEGRKVQYKLTEEALISNIYEIFENSRYINFISKFTGFRIPKVKRIVKSAINIFCLSIKDKNVKSFNFLYTSSDIEGNPITLSAKLYLPEDAISSNSKLKGLILSNRSTLTKTGEEPTESEQFESIMAWKGYAVVMPDGYGFGIDSAHPQAFMNTQLVGRNHLDAVLAAQQIIDDMQLSCEDKLVNSGYSQGGTSAIATQKYAIDHPEEDIVFSKTFAGGGAYDFNICYDSLVSGDYQEAVRFTILSIISLNESEKLGLDYSHIFKEPILSNYDELILSKKYDVFEIMDKIGTETPVSDILDEGIINKSSTESSIIRETIREYDLTTGMEIPDQTEIYILHSTTDDFVPFDNFTKLQNSITGKNIHFYYGNYGTHFKSALKLGNIIMTKIDDE